MLEGLLLPPPAYGLGYSSFVATLQPLSSLGASEMPSTRNGYFKISMTSQVGSLWGSPWGTNVTYDSYLGRIVRQSCPDIDVYNETVRNKRTIALKLKYLGSIDKYISVTRNGDTSSAYGRYNGAKIIDFLYFDAFEGKGMRLNPFEMTDPVVWDGKFLP